MGLGILLILAGLTSILPVFGIWMLPLGVFFLAIDLPMLRPVKNWMKTKMQRWAGVKIEEKP